jgi:phosphoglycerate dehydrogenase-like enzyme
MVNAKETPIPIPVWFERAHWPGMDEVRRAGIEVLGPGTPADVYHGVENAVAIVAGVCRYNGAVMDRVPNLKVIARTGIGYDSVNVVDATARNIMVCNAPDGPTIPTAEHAMALMLATAKRLPIIQRHLRENRDNIRSHNSFELHGKQLGLVGYGRIARRVAAAASALGMEVTAFDPFLDDLQFQGVTRSPDLAEMLSAADVVSVHIPLTDQSRGLFDRETLGGMKRGAILINTSRGGLVETDALLEAVNSGRLGAVGLDVTDPEPLPINHPLLSLENVLITPHVASWTKEAKRRMLLTAVEEVRAVMSGRIPGNLINPEVRVNRTGDNKEPLTDHHDAH